jgi:hypothetical protein
MRKCGRNTCSSSVELRAESREFKTSFFVLCSPLSALRCLFDRVSLLPPPVQPAFEGADPGDSLLL